MLKQNAIKGKLILILCTIYIMLSRQVDRKTAVAYQSQAGLEISARIKCKA
ncbi:hypothetical protein ACRRVD_02610 [Candidatus Cardinium hertigii]|uniref:hypothetical protein n=1 Tax=Candidatus Cardinium hertigii TaxID=247481 RepID=UPI003D7EC6DD